MPIAQLASSTSPIAAMRSLALETRQRETCLGVCQRDEILAEPLDLSGDRIQKIGDLRAGRKPVLLECLRCRSESGVDFPLGRFVKRRRQGSSG